MDQACPESVFNEVEESIKNLVIENEQLELTTTDDADSCVTRTPFEIIIPSGQRVDTTNPHVLIPYPMEDSLPDYMMITFNDKVKNRLQ